MDAVGTIRPNVLSTHLREIANYTDESDYNFDTATVWFKA